MQIRSNMPILWMEFVTTRANKIDNRKNWANVFVMVYSIHFSMWSRSLSHVNFVWNLHQLVCSAACLFSLSLSPNKTGIFLHVWMWHVIHVMGANPTVKHRVIGLIPNYIFEHVHCSAALTRSVSFFAAVDTLINNQNGMYASGNCINIGGRLINDEIELCHNDNNNHLKWHFQ